MPLSCTRRPALQSGGACLRILRRRRPPPRPHRPSPSEPMVIVAAAAAEALACPPTRTRFGWSSQRPHRQWCGAQHCSALLVYSNTILICCSFLLYDSYSLFIVSLPPCNLIYQQAHGCLTGTGALEHGALFQLASSRRSASRHHVSPALTFPTFWCCPTWGGPAPRRDALHGAVCGARRSVGCRTSCR